MHGDGSGFVEAFLDRGSQIQMPQASTGAEDLSARFLKGIYRNWESRYLPLRCPGSGLWWRIITDRFGTDRRWQDRLG